MIVGRNGDGKSTLLKLLAKRMQPDGGRITHRNNMTFGLLDQADVIDPGQTIGQAVVGDMPEHEWAGNAKVREVFMKHHADLLDAAFWQGHQARIRAGHVHDVFPYEPGKRFYLETRLYSRTLAEDITLSAPDDTHGTKIPKGTEIGDHEMNLLRDDGVTPDTWDREAAGIRVRRERLTKMTS